MTVNWDEMFGIPLDGVPKNKIEGVVDYDEIDNSAPDNKVNGKMPKKFVRMSSKYFERFFVEREKGNISYGTCFTEEDDAMGFIPTFVPALVKQRSMKRDDIHETFAPAVLNCFGVPTVFNTICEDEKGYGYIASIDFIKPGEKFALLSEIGNTVDDFGYRNNLEKSLKSVSDVVVGYHEKLGYPLSKETYDVMIADFVKSYLTRFCLMGDCDFTPRNYGFLENSKTKTIRTAPNYDFELCFRNDPTEKIENDIIFATENYPEIMEEFAKKLELFTKKNNGVPYYETLHDEICEDTKYRQVILDALQKNSKQILKVYENQKVRI